MEEFEKKLVIALNESPSSEVLIEKSLLGWKEFELEVMRDRSDTCVVVCSLENIDPCGVHTGDSLCVAPQQTLSDREYQDMRDEAFKVISLVGLEAGGANIQFAVHPKTRKRLVIEVNPRVSRSSALASKATGFPIAKIATLVALGFTMDEIKNDITRTTPACYEPALDYVVVKIPRFDFEKFEGSSEVLNTQMKSVGEVMGIGRTFLEAYMKALMSLEKDLHLLKGCNFTERDLSYPNAKRAFFIFQALRDGHSTRQIQEWTGIDPWFLNQFQKLVSFEKTSIDLAEKSSKLDPTLIWLAKRMGIPDFLLAHWFKLKERDIRKFRWRKQIHPQFFRVDTCAGEFASSTPYFYSSYFWSWSTSQPKKLKPDSKNEILILGSGPNRIGQGIEFDYSCVRSVKMLKKLSYKVIMLNSNPETVSTDYDTSDTLFFEPLSEEHALEVLNFTRPLGFFGALGGQTALNLAPALVSEGFPLIGTSLQSIRLAEDRVSFAKLCSHLQLNIPLSQSVSSLEKALKAGERTGYPLICRPSYVLGGWKMEILENEEELKNYFLKNDRWVSPKNPFVLDQFLSRHLEVDVDLVAGSDWVVVGGILEHIEATGVHSGDSMAVLPPQRLKPSMYKTIESLSITLARNLGILGFLNLQLAIKEDQITILEANPRASRSLPFLSKATSLPLVDLGVLAMLGWKKEQLNLSGYDWSNLNHVAVKAVVFSFNKFDRADSILGPEMKSLGEVMGRGKDYSEALLKAFLASGAQLPKSGHVLLSLRDKDKEELLSSAKKLKELGYQLIATRGTASFLNSHGVECKSIKKVREGRPHCVDFIRSKKACLVVNTSQGRNTIAASFSIRRSCIDQNVPCVTESEAAIAIVQALHSLKKQKIYVSPLPSLQKTEHR